jgi:excisionase family DNA binding protein
MSRQITVSEYAKLNNVHERTVYRWIQQGKVKSDKVDGNWLIELDDDIRIDISHDKEMTILRLQVENSRLKEEVNYLRKQIDGVREERERYDIIIQQMQQDAEAARQRSDTIILHLTRQFEEQTKLLEDMRQSRASGLWSRVKTAFGFAAS